MNPQDPLAQLRDIHLPPPIGWWPPAPGWWLLALLLLCSMSLLLWWLLKRHRHNRYRREALSALSSLGSALSGQSLPLCQEVLALLRRTARTAYPGAGIEAELIPRLLQRLNQGCRKPPFGQTLQEQLRDIPYQSTPDIPEQLLHELQSAAQHWIKRHRRGAPC